MIHLSCILHNILKIEISLRKNVGRQPLCRPWQGMGVCFFLEFKLLYWIEQCHVEDYGRSDRRHFVLNTTVVLNWWWFYSLSDIRQCQELYLWCHEWGEEDTTYRYVVYRGKDATKHAAVQEYLPQQERITWPKMAIVPRLGNLGVHSVPSWAPSLCEILTSNI